MKSLIRVAFVLIIGSLILGFAEVRAADWKRFKKTEDAKFYYDEKDVSHSPTKMVTVWIRQIYTKKGKTDMINMVGPRYENLSYSINSLEFDCGAKLVRFLAMTYYSKNDDVLDLENPPDQWESIRSHSVYDALYKKVCK